jgi:hypothetical protein
MISYAFFNEIEGDVILRWAAYKCHEILDLIPEMKRTAPESELHKQKMKWGVEDENKKGRIQTHDSCCCSHERLSKEGRREN